jgi:hypothetical protein
MAINHAGFYCIKSNEERGHEEGRSESAGDVHLNGSGNNSFDQL